MEDAPAPVPPPDMSAIIAEIRRVSGNCIAQRSEERRTLIRAQGNEFRQKLIQSRYQLIEQLKNTVHTAQTAKDEEIAKKEAKLNGLHEGMEKLKD